MTFGHTGAVRSNPRRPLLRLAAVTAALALLVGACSDEGGDSSGSGSDNALASVGEKHKGAPPVPESCIGSSDAPSGDDADSESQDDQSEMAPDPEVLAAIEERGKPDPAAVVAEVGDSTEPVDLVEGSGEEVIADGAVQIHYSVINPADSSELESSWSTGEMVPIPVGQVFDAFAESMKGMKVGGRRAFVVPATAVVGDPPPPESGLTADDDVLFVVDLASVSAEAPEMPGAAGSVEADEDAQAAVDKRGAPEVKVPEGTKDTDELIWIDDVVGTGAVVCPGDSVLAHYTGIQASDGEEFDSSWDRGEPIEFSLDGVIKGWTDGLVGMKVGGRRTLVIPPDQAYGDENPGGGPSGVLVFTIDLVGVS